jgi:hypothetical protein
VVLDGSSQLLGWRYARAHGQYHAPGQRQVTGRPVTVPPHHDVTGAIEAALHARDERRAVHDHGGEWQSRFRGFDLRHRHYATRTFICQACPNLCEINRVTIDAESPLFYGARCEMYEDAGLRKQNRPEITLPDLYAERQAALMGDYQPPNGRRSGRLRVGLARTLHFYDLFPYWRTFFDELGMDLLLSGVTDPHLARLTRDHVAGEACYPVKLGYGHVAELLEQDLDLLFLPAVLDRENKAPGQVENTYCLYIRAAGVAKSWIAWERWTPPPLCWWVALTAWRTRV